MSRPLMQQGVAQLEQMFAAKKSDSKVLKQLENELRYRQVPRAISLLAEVQAALYSPTREPDLVKAPPAGAAAPPAPSPKAAPTPATATPPATAQPGLWVVAETGRGGQEVPAPAITLVAARQSAGKATEPPPEVTLTEAMSLFKVTARSPWETVVQTRRLLVQASSPSRTKGMNNQQRADAQSQSRRINAAYEVLSQARAGIHIVRAGAMAPAVADRGRGSGRQFSDNDLTSARLHQGVSAPDNFAGMVWSRHARPIKHREIAARSPEKARDLCGKRRIVRHKGAGLKWWRAHGAMSYS